VNTLENGRPRMACGSCGGKSSPVEQRAMNNHLVQDETRDVCVYVLAPATLCVLVCLNLANSS